MILANGFTVRRTNPARAGGYACGKILISDPQRFRKTFANGSRGFKKPLRWFGETNSTTNRGGGYLYPTHHEVLRNLCVGLEKPTAPNVREDTHIRPKGAGGYLYPTHHEVLRNLCVGLEKPTAPNVREDTHIRPLRCEKGPEQRPILHRNCSVSDKNLFTYSLNYLYINPFLILAQL